jgi:uncharacterized protein (DUF2236 family)
MTSPPPETTFPPDAMLRRVVGHRMTALSGPRALLLMAAHPVAFQGFFAHTGALDDPYARLQRTAVVMDAVAFGTRAEAERRTRRVRAMHRRVEGVLTEDAGRFPAGTPYRADDPELLLWILASLADSAMLVYSKYVERLDGEARDALWADYRVVGRHFGLRERDMPADADAFDAYMADMLASGDLFVTDRARELAVEIVLHPPVPARFRPLLELVNQTTFGLLPPSIRRMYGFSWDPIRALALHGGAEYLKRVVVPVLPQRVARLPVARAA